MDKKEYLRRDRIRLGTKGSFQPQLLCDEYLQTFADCGFDWVVVNAKNSYGEAKDKILDFCDRNGEIEVFLDDRKTCYDSQARKEYEFHPCYCGSYLNDEPGTDEMDELAVRANGYRKENHRPTEEAIAAAKAGDTFLVDYVRVFDIVE